MLGGEKKKKKKIVKVTARVSRASHNNISRGIARINIANPGIVCLSYFESL